MKVNSHLTTLATFLLQKIKNGSAIVANCEYCSVADTLIPCIQFIVPVRLAEWSKAPDLSSGSRCERGFEPHT